MEHIYSTPHGEIHYWLSRTAEDVPWLVFLPGLTADHHLFDKQWECLIKGFNCFIWDAPAHGKSRPFKLEFSMQDLADYLHAVFTTEKINAPVLVGQSLGGYIAQAYIDKYPDSVSGLTALW